MGPITAEEYASVTASNARDEARKAAIKMQLLEARVAKLEKQHNAIRGFLKAFDELLASVNQ